MEYKPNVGNIVHEYPKRIMMYLEDHRISKLLLTLQYSNVACWKIHQQQFKDFPVHRSIYSVFFICFPCFQCCSLFFSYSIMGFPNCRRKCHCPRARPDSLPSQLLQESHILSGARVERSNCDFPMECDQHHIQCSTPTVMALYQL